MSCRLIISPITGKEVESKTWNDIRSLVETDDHADQLYENLISQDFINWFGDWLNDPKSASKVVNEDGEPLVVYHGTTQNFDSFNSSLSSRAAYGKGVYFTNNKKDAYRWARQDEENFFQYEPEFAGDENPNRARVIPTFLNIRNPQNPTDLQSFVPSQYDGAIVNNGEELIVLNSTQIKSVFNQGEFNRENDNIYLQTEENNNSSKATSQQISNLKDWLKRVGIDIKQLDPSRYGGINGVANLSEKWIGITEGMENVALPEEAFHFGVAILKQTNPKLYREMLSSISNYQIYTNTFSNYKDNPNYQNNGKPDIVKLKEEAIGKMLASIYTSGEENQQEELPHLQKAQSWLSQLIDWFKQLVGIGGNPFKQAIEEVLNTSEEQVQETLSEVDNSEFFQLNEGNRLYDLIKTNKGVSIAKIEATGDKEGPNRRHYLINGVEKIFKSVTDRTKAYFEKVAGNVTPSEYEKIARELKAEEGTKGHADIEQIVNLLTTEEGLLKPSPEKDATYIPQTSQAMYDKLYDYLLARMNMFPPGTRFLSEVMVYDNIQKEAGTIDFLAITEEGEATILDWKFQDLTGKTDVPWYKKEANNIQLQRYKQILSTIYGVKKFSNQSAAIPIQSIFTYKQLYKDKGDKNKYPVLENITIGDPNVKNIVRTELLPVLLSDASTGDPKLDRILKKMNAAKEKLVDQMKQSRDDVFKESKRVQIELMDQAIRHLQVKQSLEPLLEQSKDFLNRVKLILDEYKNSLSKLDPKKDQEEWNKFAIKIQQAETELEIYTELDVNTRHLFEQDDDPVKLHTIVVAGKARDLKSDLIEMNNEFTSRLGTSRNITEFLKPELAIKGIAKIFTETSKLPTKALNLFSKLRTEAKNKADFQTDEENTQLLDIQKRYTQWAKSKGLKNIFSPITKGDSNRLLDQYESEFYSQAKLAAKNKDVTWITDNVDMPTFIAEIERLKQRDLSIARSRILPTDHEPSGLELDKFADEQAKIEKKYSLEKDGDGWNKYFAITKQPQKKWETEQWIQLNKPENSTAKDFYDWIININQKAHEVGYLPEGKSPRTFLPFVPKSLVQKLVEGNVGAIAENFWLGITIDENSIGYGEIDKATGKPKDKIPAYLLQPHKEGDSSLLFQNMALYNQFVNNYKALSDIEGLALAIGRTERNKQSIASSFLGNPLIKNGTREELATNDVNASLYEDQMKALIYGQKYVASDRFDVLLGQVNPTFQKINKKIGFNLFPTNLEGRQISLNRTIDGMNNWFQIKALGINPVTALANRLGSFFQSIINAGTWFTKSDVLKAEAQLLTKHLQGEEGAKFIAALRYFMPFTEGSNHELMKKLAGTWTDAQNIQDWLMVMMRSGDRGVQAQIFHALLNNMIVIEGEIHNVREYYRKSPEYIQRYSNGNLKEAESQFETEVAKLKDRFGLLKLSSVKEGMLEIPGVERKSDTVYQARNLSLELTKKTTGQMTDDEIRGYQQNIFLKSVMLFKNWIPSLADTRFGKLKFNDKTQAYEWGRARTVARFILNDGFFPAMSNFLSIVKGTPTGIGALHRLYQEKKERYERMTGKDFHISEAEFYDMTRQNISSAAKDALMMVGLVSMWLLAKAAVPDDDEDPLVMNWYKFAAKVADKIKDELSFFYNPFSVEAILNGSIFPSFHVITDGMNVLTHFATEVWALSTDNEKLEDKNFVIKYLAKSFPVTSQISSWLPLMAPDAAKEYGVRMSTESRTTH